MLDRYRVTGVGSKPIMSEVDVDPTTVPSTYPRRVPSWPDSTLVTKRCSLMRDNTFIRGWNPVNHTRINVIGGGKSHPCPLDQADFVSRVSLDHMLEMTSNTVAAAINNPQFLQWRATVMSRIEHQIDPSMSLAVSLFELKKGVKEFLPTMEDLRQNAGGNFLKIKFGIQPFIDDLKNSLDVWSHFTGRLSFLKKTRGKTFIHKRRLSLELEDPEAFNLIKSFYWLPNPPPIGSSGGGGIPGGPGGGPPVQPAFVDHRNDTKYQVSVVETKFWIHGIVQNLIGDMDNLVDQADAFGRVVGFGNSPRILWNILPWSWMFDWFVDTNQVLDRFEDSGPFEGKLALNECYLTQKVTSRGEIIAQCPHYEVSSSDGDFMTRNYVRNIGVEAENLDSRIIQPLLNGSQEAILLALLIQRGKAVPNWIQIEKKLRKLL